MLNGTRAQMSAIIVALLLVAVASAAATFIGTKDHDEDHLALDIIKHQRELTKEISLLALTRSQESDLEPAINAFQQNMDALRSGGDVILADGGIVTIDTETDPAIQQALEQLPGSWITFRDSTIEIGKLSSDDTGWAEAAVSLQESSLSLLGAIGRLDVSYANHMEHDLTNLRLWQTILLISAISLLTWGIIAVRRRVLRLSDLVTAFEQAQDGQDINPLPQEVYADEVADLVELFDLIRPGMTIAQQSLEKRVLRRTRELMTAFEYSQEIVSELDKHEILRQTLTKAESLVSAHSTALCLIEPDGSLLELSAIHGRIEAKIAIAHTKAAHQPYQIMPIIPGTSLAEACNDCLFAKACVGENVLTVPLKISENQVGSLCVVREPERPFDANEHQSLQLLANSAAIAISNSRLADNNRFQARQDAIKAEREHLAAALHDNLAQTLSYLNLKADRAIQMVVASDSNQALDELSGMKSATSDAYDKVREVLDNLSNSPKDRDSTTVAAISDFIADYQEMTGLDVNFSLDEQALARLSPTVQQQIIHITRESLTNVSRHAQATAVTVRLQGRADGAELLIEDNGRGFDPQQQPEGTHLGLTIMQARARRSGGALVINSEPNRGTIISAYLPHQEIVAIRAN